MFKHIAHFALVVAVVGWIFSGWPQVWQSPPAPLNKYLTGPFPPGVSVIRAASSTETFTGTTSWQAPTGVTVVTAEVWGGGGGGGGQNLSSDGGGGGGGGAYSKKNAITVVPGNSYTVTVGAAGAGNAGCTASTAGGDSWFSTIVTVFAKGGGPGACSTGTPPVGGDGGDPAAGEGDVLFGGGDGEKGRNNTTGSGGYGGSSAGTASHGFSGPTTWSTVTYPTGSTPTGASHGGDGGGPGVAGSAPVSGNGGGGGGAGEGTNISGGNGTVGKIILTYNKPPNAPTQSAPANSATGVSVTPTFTMTATDADTTPDKVSYKVTIYSDSGCTAVVQTNDQAVSATGWTGSDTSCTANPTACYASGTQGSYVTQSALSYNTQYWWKASAKDPDGNGSFTDSASCNTFTTLASTPVYSISISSSGVVEYGFVQIGTASSTVGNGYTQVAENDGNADETLNIKSSDATGGTSWTLASSIGSDLFKHEFSTTTGATWAVLPDSATYVLADPSVAVSDTVNFDFRLTAPSASTDYQQKSITLTIQAVAP